MKLDVRKLGWLATPMLLLGTLVLTCLPAGFAPKISGPCGNELCNCPWVVAGKCHACSSPKKKHAPRAKLVLESASLSGTDGPVVALHEVFSGVLIPAPIVLAIDSETVATSIPDYCFSAQSVTLEIPTPPPRC